MRTIKCLRFAIWLCGLLIGSLRAETYVMTDGTSIIGDVVSFNESGVIVRQSDDKYSERLLWTKLSQDSLKKLSEDSKLQPLIEPFLDVPLDSGPKASKVEIGVPERLQRPETRSLLGAMFTSSVGLFVILMIYLANFYAAYEVSIFRARPKGLVCGVSAVLPVVGPILFLALPQPGGTRRAVEEEEEEAPAAAPALTPTAPTAAAPVATSSAAAPKPFMPSAPAIAGMHRPASSAPSPVSVSSASAKAESASSTGAIPQKQVFQRGAFTFNRRFFETKFAGFLGVVRKESEKDMVMAVKSARGEYVGQRIAKLTAGELYLQVETGPASEEVMLPFSEIKEIVLRHKDA